MSSKNIHSIFSIAKESAKPLILDGAMGSLLQQKGIKSSGSLWTALTNLEVPELVLEIHKDYINAGADIITTNTFRTNPAAVHGSVYSVKELVKKAVEIAKAAAAGKSVLIGGSNAPAEDCYQIERRLTQKELEYNHKKHIDLLLENGVDFILNETQSHKDEIEIIASYCSKNSIPFIVSLFTSDGTNLLSNNQLGDIIKLILSYNPSAVGFNCIPDDIFKKIYKEIHLNFNWGFYLNLGSGNYNDEIISNSVEEKEFREIIPKYLDKNPSFIGACCGSKPKHINELTKLVKKKVI